MVNIEIDGISFNVPKNTTILQACTKAGIDIPRFCFHERLLIAGNCRMCLVEIEKLPKPVASCTFPVMEGIKIFTNTPLVQKARESVMEFLLLNHPLDCPICDQGGECDLQDQSFFYGSDSGRFYNEKRSVEDKIAGPLIKTIMTRCIHCTRCIRFATEIAGISSLGTTGRGKKTEIGSYIKNILNSELSGNVIDLCPVSSITTKFKALGALTSKPAAYQGRTWELEQIKSIDVLDGLGSNVSLNLKGNEVLRIIPCFNEDINEEWISDKTRFYYDSLNIQRLLFPKYQVQTNVFETKTWQEVFNLIKVFMQSSSNKIGIITGKFTDIETLLISKSFLNLNGSSMLFNEDLFSSNNFSLNFSFNYKFNTLLNLIDNTDLGFLVQTNPRKEASVLNIRLRKQVNQGKMKVATIGSYEAPTFDCNFLGLNSNNLFSVIEGNHYFAKDMQKASKPLIIFGNNDFKNNSQQFYSILKSNLNLSFTKSYNFINFLTTNMGLINSCEIGLKSINLKKLQSLNTIFLLNTSNFNLNLLNKNTKVIFIGSNGPNDVSNIDLLLPGVSVIENDSHFLNINSFLQQTKKVSMLKKDSRYDWKIFNALLHFFDLSKNVTNKTNLMKNYSNIFSFSYKKSYVKECFLLNNTFQKEFKTTTFSKPNVRDFYISDILTKNSRILNKCSLNNKRLNFKNVQ